MNPIHRLAPLFVCTSILLTGCAGVLSNAPTYPQDHVVTDFPPFSIAIDKCYWNDGSLQGKIPPEMLSSFDPEVQWSFQRTPRGEFLVVEFTVTNTGNQPAVFPGLEEGPPPHYNYPPVFTLRDTINGNFYSLNTGRVDAAGRGACLLADFIMNGRVAINPGQSTKGFLAFTILPPRGAYELNVYSGEWLGLRGEPVVPSSLNQYRARSPLFNWTLNPSGG
jgi:hypothetical protein